MAKFKLDNSLSLAWGLQGGNKVDSVLSSESITYPEILASTDLEYKVFSDGLKENIILKDAHAPNAFKFNLFTSGLQPVLQEDGSIILQNSKSKEQKLVLPPAYMIDKNNTISDKVKITLTPTKNPNLYELTLTADLNWLQDSSRVFPITIDPSIKSAGIYLTGTEIQNGGSDTYVASNNATPQFNHFYMTSGWDTNFGKTRSLIKFPLNSIPKNVIITDALFRVYKYTTPPVTSEQLVVSRVTQPWTETNVTWTPTDDFTNQETQSSLVSVPGSKIGWVDFNVWSIVKGWVNGHLDNNGFMLRHNVEDQNHPLFFYYTSDNGSNTPTLTVTYMTDPIGVNPYWSYANTEVSSVNTFNGNFLSSVTDFSLPGRGIPITVARTYNSRGNLSGIFGSQWFSNLDMQLNDFNLLIGSGRVFVDATGTERPFLYKSDGVNFVAPDNYPVQLYRRTDTQGQTIFVLQESYMEPDSTVPNYTYNPKLPSLTFNSNGKLIMIDDGKTNLTKIDWGPDTVTVTDPSGRKVTLNLSSGRVATIKDHNNAEMVSYDYDPSSGYLKQVTYEDATYGNSSIKYSWDKGRLRSITDKNGTPYYLNYDEPANRIASVGEINLLGNPSFEAGYGSNLDSWEEKADNGYGSITEDSSTATTGKGSVHIQSTPNYPGTDPNSLYLSQKIPIKPSTTYNLSAKIKTGNLNGQAFLKVVQTDTNGIIMDSTAKDTRATALTGTKDWTQQSLSVTTQSTAGYLIVYQKVDQDSAHFGGDAYFDEAQLVEGAPATEFHGHTEIGFGTNAWITSPLGEVTQYAHTNFGNPTAVIADSGGLNSTTSMTWNVADQLKSLTTPLGSVYSYEYDPLGYMKKAFGPNDRNEEYEYYYNRLKKLTQADNKNVQNAWNPVGLDNQSQTDQAGNSKAYAYNAGNLTMESNLLGIADNRIYNSGFNEVDSNSQPLEWERVAPAGSTNLSEDDPTAPYGGSRVLKLNSGTNHNTYQWTGFISVADKANGSYILSGDIKASVTGTSSGAAVFIYWYDASQQPTGSPSSNLYFQVNDSKQNDKWNHYTALDIQPPANAVYARIMTITYQGCTGYYDKIQLEQSPQSRGYNALQNSSFVNGLSKWIRSNSYADVIAQVGTINLPSTGSAYLESQTVLPVKQNQEYTLSGNLSTEQMTAASGNGASLKVTIYDQAGIDKGTFQSQVVSENSELTKYVVPIKSPVNGTAKVRLDMTGAKGVAKFDNVRFSFEREVVTSTYDPLSNYVRTTTNQLGKTVSYDNDAYGQAKSVTSPTGEVIRYAYDGQERLRTVTDNAGNLTTYTLDANGNVLSANTKTPTGTIYNQSSFVYDDKNNLKAEKNSSNAIVSNYAYDLNGRLSQKTNASGSTVSLDYSPLGLLKTLRLSSNESYGFSYDLEGRRKQATVSNGPTLTYKYDYDYDAVGNLTSYIERDGSNNILGSIAKPAAGEMYSKTDQLIGFDMKYKTTSAIPYAFFYSSNKLVEKVSAAGKDTLFKYDEGSKLKLQTNANGVEDRFDYNEGNQLIGTSTFNPAAIILQKSRARISMMTMAALKKLSAMARPVPRQRMFTMMLPELKS